MLRFAIIGCGRIAQRHAEQIALVGKLVAVCDVVAEKAKLLAAKYSCIAYEQIDDLLRNEEKPDIVSVCTPNGLHAAHSIRSLQAGCHVLCEKPMSITVSDCHKMIEAAEKANRELFIVKQNRFNPPVAELKKIIDQGILGKIFSFQVNCFWNRDRKYYHESWRGTKELDGGTLFTQFSHFIDLLYWTLGDVEEASGFITNSNHQGIIEFEDSGTISLTLKNGVIGGINYTVNSYQKNMEGSFTVFGEKGTVKIGGQYLNELGYQAIENHAIKNLNPSNPPNRYGEYEGSMSNHDKVYENMIDALNGKAKASTNGFEGMKTVEIIQKIYQSVSWVK